MAADSVSQSVVLAMMRERGIDNGDELLRFASHARIAAACRWWDSKRGAGPGVLAKTIREGGMAEVRPARSLLDEQADYGRQIVDWLREHFPQWNRDDGNRTHPEAIIAVIHLRHQHGNGRLTVREHGGIIREAVARFDASSKTPGGESC